MIRERERRRLLNRTEKVLKEMHMHLKLSGVCS